MPGEVKMQMPWTNIKEHKISNAQPPEDWPKGVSPISQDGLALFGIHESTGDIYWDGKRVETKLTLGGKEAWLAWAVGISTVIMAFVEVLKLYLGQ